MAACQSDSTKSSFAENLPGQNDQAESNNWWTALWDWFRFHMGMFTGSLVATVVIMPFVAVLVTVMLYLAFSDPSTPPLLPPFAQILPSQLHNRVYCALTYGAIITFHIWLLSTMFCSLFATAEKANIRSYGGLKDHLYELESRLGLKEGSHGKLKPVSLEGEDPRKSWEPWKKTAWEEAGECCAYIVKHLWHHRSGISWVLGTDYINMWEMYHRAEEASIMFMPLPQMIGEARHDQLSLKNASINNCEELLDNVQQAIEELNPAAATYFRKCQPHDNCQVVKELRQTLDQYKEALKKVGATPDQIEPRGNGADNSNAKAGESKDDNAHARVVVSQVRHSLNEYRTHLWEKLLETRNQLLVTIALAGSTTYVLFFISIVATPPPATNTVLAAVVFYIVGALTGLSARFYKESGSGSTLVGDYNLSLVHLITVPLLSGLAGIGGVLLTVMLTAWSVQNQGQQHLVLEAVFHVEPGFLLIAAAFGLSPNLLIQGLQKRAEKYALDIEKTRPEGAKTGDTNTGKTNA